MTRSLALAVVLLAILAAPAGAGVVIQYDNGQPAPVLQKWADDALVPTVAGTVVVTRDFCPGLADYGASCIDLATDRMWLRTWFAENLRSTLAHELGHRFDWHVMTLAARREFRRIMGYWRRGAWWGELATASPSELFADAYSACWRIRVLRSWLSSPYDYDPSPDQHRRVCRLIRLVAVGAYGTPR